MSVVALPRPLSPRAHGASGASLVEVLVAITVFSLGILAAVALQLISKRSAADADHQSTAAYLAYDLVERIRSNNAQGALISYNSAPTLGRGSRGANPPVNCAAAACTPSQLAFFDLWEWERRLDGDLERINGTSAGGLTNPTACINGPAGGSSGLYTVTVAWRSSTGLPSNDDNDCGLGLELYGDDEQYRRLTTVQIYVLSR